MDVVSSLITWGTICCGHRHVRVSLFVANLFLRHQRVFKPSLYTNARMRWGGGGGQPRERSGLPNEEGYATADTVSDQPSLVSLSDPC